MSSVQWRKPRLHTSLIFLVLIVTFCFAARWQWQRAEFKLQRSADFAAAMAEPALRTLVAALSAPSTQGFDRVRFAGSIDSSRLLLLDNQIRDGQFGVEVYALLSADSGQHVIAGLGWIASDASRQTLPAIPPIGDRIEGEGMLTAAPASGLQLGSAQHDAKPAFPLLLTRIDPVELRAILQVPDLAERIVMLAPDPHSGFRRDWHLNGLTADKHRGYALQWISFAVGTLVFFVLWHRPRQPRPLAGKSP